MKYKDLIEQELENGIDSYHFANEFTSQCIKIFINMAFMSWLHESNVL